MQALLHNWLPGGITGVYVISLKPAEREVADRNLRLHFPDLIHTNGYKPDIQAFGDYDKLPLSVSDRTKMHIHAKEGQAHHRDLASFGGIGCAISHLLQWKNVAAPSGWSIIFEWDCVFKKNAVDLVRDFTKQQPPNEKVSMLRLVYNNLSNKNEENIPENNLFVKHRTHLYGTTMCVVANAWANKLYNHLSSSIDMHIDLALNLASYLGSIPPTWFLRNSMGQPMTHKSTTSAKLSMKKYFPDDVGQSNAIIFAVLVSLFLVLVLAIVFIVLYSKSGRKKNNKM
jgi:GR25 family glycosyltransferase involved in LPS biosynthesis